MMIIKMYVLKVKGKFWYVIASDVSIGYQDSKLDPNIIHIKRNVCLSVIPRMFANLNKHFQRPR